MTCAKCMIARRDGALEALRGLLLKQWTASLKLPRTKTMIPEQVVDVATIEEMIKLVEAS